jgi:hypothetical protein
MRAMVKFDLPSLPEGSTIESAKLHLYANSVTVQNLTSKPLRLHRITGSWTQTGVTWNNKPSFNSTTLDQTEFSALATGWITLDVPVSVLEGWYAAPSSNHGLLLKRSTDSGSPGWTADRFNNVQFDSSESLTASRRPKLEIEYSVETGDWVTITKFQAETSAGHQGTFDTVSDRGTVTITGPEINPLAPSDPFTATWTFNITDLDLDGWRGNNDSMTVAMEMKTDLASGAGNTELLSQRAVDTAQTAYFTCGPDDSVRINGDEVVTFTPRAVSYSLNGQAPRDGTFEGFLTADVHNLTGGNATISGETIGGTGGTLALASRPAILAASAGGSVRYRLTNIGFRINANTPTGGGDMDGDGLDDAWEREHFGSITVSDGTVGNDRDGDGAPDGDEYITGSDPNDPDSACRMVYDGRRRHGRWDWGDVVSWPSVTGRVYDVQRSFDLLGDWETVLEGVVASPPQNEENVLVDQNAPSAIYRVLVNWPDAP